MHAITNNTDTKLSYEMRPAPTMCHDASVKACWTIHADDGFATQIGVRLERHANHWRMVFANNKSVTVDTERDACVLVQGILLGRCLC